MTEDTKKTEGTVEAAAVAENANDAVVQGRGFTMKRDWQTWIIVVAAFGAALWGLVGPVGSGLGLWHFGAAISGMFMSFWLCVGAAILGALFVWLGKRSGKPRRPLLWLAILVAVLYAGWLANLASRADPKIHDISTDLADPPQFKVLEERADNWEAIPTDCRDNIASMTPKQRWKICHQDAYGDIRSVNVNMSVNDVIAKAERLANDRGWKIAALRPAEGRLEATDTTALFRFKDDVVLRVRPTESGTGSIVDMRSVSRVGVSDLGVNAGRVRDFLADLSGTVTAD